MSEDEVFEKLGKISSSNPDLANRMYTLWKEDNTRDYETLEKLAGVGFDALAKKETSKVRSPVTEAFGISEDQYRLLIDPNSKINWMKLPTKELLKAAIKGGYVKDLPKNAPEYKKKEQRAEFNTFLKMLANESNLQGRRNAIREYENTKFSEDPIGWAQKGINSLLFRTYAKRAKEQALKGKGASSFLGMDAGDVGALGGDIGVNAMLGAGAGGISSSLFGRGVGHAGLRTFGNVAGSDLAAGVLGGLGSVANRDMNTDEGARGYEYLTEPVLTGALNVVATPATLRTGVATAANMFGIGGAKVNGIGKRNLMQTAQRLADQKYAEPALAARLRELEADAARTVENSPVSRETAAKIDEMFDILNEGTVADVDGYVPFNDLQDLFRSSAKQKTGLSGDQLDNVLKEWERTGSAEMAPTPSTERFRLALDKKIGDLEGSIKNNKGTTEGVAEARELAYLKNFRELMDNGLIDAETYLKDADAAKAMAPKSKYVLTEGTENVPFFELGKKANQEDIDFMKDYINNVNIGYNLSYDNGLALKMREMQAKYPEFDRYVKSQRLLPGHNVSQWSSRGTNINAYPEGVAERILIPEKNYAPIAGHRAYGVEDPIKAGRGEEVVQPQWSARDVLKAMKYGASDVAMDIAKPAVVEARLTKYDKPDNSLEALTEQYEKLRARKPEAVDAAMSFKFDPRLEQSKQLTLEERNLIDKFREAQRKAVLGE